MTAVDARTIGIRFQQLLAEAVPQLDRAFCGRSPDRFHAGETGEWRAPIPRACIYCGGWVYFAGRLNGAGRAAYLLEVTGRTDIDPGPPGVFTAYGFLPHGGRLLPAGETWVIV